MVGVMRVEGGPGAIIRENFHERDVPAFIWKLDKQHL
jgi:hypothetical protein